MREAPNELVAGPQSSWAICTRTAADLRRAPTRQSELVSQAVWGEAVELLQQEGGWIYVRLPDGYLGWLYPEAVWPCDRATVANWEAGITHMVQERLLPCYADMQEQQQVGLLPWGSPLIVEDFTAQLAVIRTPDNRQRWVSTSGILPWNERPPATSDGLRLVANWSELMIGVPYLWGGRTPFGYDCSGLMQIMYRVLDIHLRRDADQQFAMGTAVPSEHIAFGDLIFFDTSTPEAALHQGNTPDVSHVGFALDSGSFLHASMRGGGVVYGALDERLTWLGGTFRERCVGVRRYL